MEALAEYLKHRDRYEEYLNEVGVGYKHEAFSHLDEIEAARDRAAAELERIVDRIAGSEPD